MISNFILASFAFGLITAQSSLANVQISGTTIENPMTFAITGKVTIAGEYWDCDGVLNTLEEEIDRKAPGNISTFNASHCTFKLGHSANEIELQYAYFFQQTQDTSPDRLKLFIKRLKRLQLFGNPLPIKKVTRVFGRRLVLAGEKVVSPIITREYKTYTQLKEAENQIGFHFSKAKLSSDLIPFWNSIYGQHEGEKISAEIERVFPSSTWIGTHFSEYIFLMVQLEGSSALLAFKGGDGYYFSIDTKNHKQSIAASTLSNFF